MTCATVQLRLKSWLMINQIREFWYNYDYNNNNNNNNNNKSFVWLHCIFPARIPWSSLCHRGGIGDTWKKSKESSQATSRIKSTGGGQRTEMARKAGNGKQKRWRVECLGVLLVAERLANLPNTHHRGHVWALRILLPRRLYIIHKTCLSN